MDPSAIASLRCGHRLSSNALAWLSSCEVDENERSVSGGFGPDSGDADMARPVIQQNLKQGEIWFPDSSKTVVSVVNGEINESKG